MLILILATNIRYRQDLRFIRQDMNALICAGSWSVDLLDEDKVLRVILSWDQLLPIFILLEKHKLKYHILNIYDMRFGIDYPLLAEDERLTTTAPGR